MPPALDRLILRCLAKRPADRPASAAELADALARLPGVERWAEARARDWWFEFERQSLVTGRACWRPASVTLVEVDVEGGERKSNRASARANTATLDEAS